MCLDELRSNIAIKQKKGLPFICASIIIWLLILIVILLDLPQNTENLLVFCCSCPLLPISWAIGKILKVDIFDKSNPLGNVGFLFTCNQFLYLLIVMWVFNAVPVSYTHLDVYKRQALMSLTAKFRTSRQLLITLIRALKIR